MTKGMANLGTKKAADGAILGTYYTCRRCKGTGWWSGQILRGCFACGGQNMRQGSGRQLRESAAGKVARLEKHAAEVRELIALEERQLETARFGRKQREERLVSYRTNLVRIEAEIAAVQS